MDDLQTREQMLGDMLRAVDAEKNWPEDFPAENGCYQCRCVVCEGLFFGHKRRRICRTCASPDAGLEGA